MECTCISPCFFYYLLETDLVIVIGPTEVAILPADTASKQGPIEAIQKSVRLFEEKRSREMRRRNIIGQVCDTPKSYDNVMHVGLRKVTFKWQRGNKIGEGVKERDRDVSGRKSNSSASLGGNNVVSPFLS